MASRDQILAQIKKRREKVVPLGDGRRKVFFLRPPEADFPKFLDKADNDKSYWRVKHEHVLEYVTGWEGFTEADLLGESVGASDVSVPFDRELWKELVLDSVDWLTDVSMAMLDSIITFLTEKAAAEKNSASASTETAESKASSSS